MVHSKYTQFIAPSTQKGKRKKGGFEVSKEKKKAKKNGALYGEAKGKGKEIEELPKLVVPGGRRGQSNEIEAEVRSERSNSRAPHDDYETANEGELEMDVDASRTSQIFNECGGSSQALVAASSPRSDSPGLDINNNQKPHIPALKTAIDIPKPPPQHADTDDTLPANEKDDSLEMHVDTPTLQLPNSSLFFSQIQNLPVDLYETWNTLTRGGLYSHLEAYAAREILSRQLLDDVTSAKDDLANHVLTFGDLLKDCYTKIKILEDDNDMLANLTRDLTEARSDVQQAVKQRLEAESELSELRRKMEELAKARDEALNEAHLLRETQAVQSEVREVDNQSLQSELSELRRKAEALAEERDVALNEAQRSRDLLQETRAAQSEAQDSELSDLLQEQEA